jgi:hypothetical protein
MKGVGCYRQELFIYFKGGAPREHYTAYKEYTLVGLLYAPKLSGVKLRVKYKIFLVIH